MRKLLRPCKNFLAARLYRPSHLRVCLGDCFDLRTPQQALLPNADHIAAAISWLCRAQDATPDGGVSARYRFDRGWAPSYPETTGYLIPTFFHYAHVAQKQEHRDRALRMSEWLLALQLDNGAFPGHDVGAQPWPVVFNTGQILGGLLSAFQETRQEKFLQACLRAGDWLAAVQAGDGSWPQYEYLNRPHAYHTRVSWPLLELWCVTGTEKYKQAALRNLQWALDRQLANGWFSQNGFSDEEHPYLHTIAYAIRGFLGAAAVLRPHDRDCPLARQYFAAAERAAAAVLHRFEIRRFPFAQYDRDWQSRERFSCLTGDSQIAAAWLLIYHGNGDVRYLNAALKINDFVKSTQNLTSANPGIRGGIKGSHPVWGKYMRYSYPNWAAKFFIDALLLQEEIMSKLESGAAVVAAENGFPPRNHEPRFVMQTP